MFPADGLARGKGNAHDANRVVRREREPHLHVGDADGADDEGVGDVVTRVVVGGVVVRHVEVVGEHLVGGRLGRGEGAVGAAGDSA